MGGKTKKTTATNTVRNIRQQVWTSGRPEEWLTTAEAAELPSHLR